MPLTVPTRSFSVWGNVGAIICVSSWPLNSTIHPVDQELTSHGNSHEIPTVLYLGRRYDADNWFLVPNYKGRIHCSSVSILLLSTLKNTISTILPYVRRLQPWPRPQLSRASFSAFPLWSYSYSCVPLARLTVCDAETAQILGLSSSTDLVISVVPEHRHRRFTDQVRCIWVHRK